MIIVTLHMNLKKNASNLPVYSLDQSVKSLIKLKKTQESVFQDKQLKTGFSDMETRKKKQISVILDITSLTWNGLNLIAFGITDLLYSTVNRILS